MRKRKYSYFINEFNQLCVRDPSTGQEKILYGEFFIDKSNALKYKLNSKEEWIRKHNIPEEIKFDGKWTLDKEYNLVLYLRKKKDNRGKKLKLRGKIKNSSENLFLFSVKSNTSPGKSKITFLKLKGFWKADKYNRLCFEVKSRQNNKLFFKSAWELNKNNQISYQYEKLKTKSKEKFVLEGYWNILNKNRIRYILEDAKESYLDFKAYLETPNVYPARGKIKYRVGIGLKKSRKEKTISVSGTWKFSRRLGLVLELDSKEEKIHRIKFKAKLTVAEKDKLIFSLYARDNNPTGVSITFLKHHPQIPNKDFEYFLRLKREGKHPRIEIGGKVRF